MRYFFSIIIMFFSSIAVEAQTNSTLNISIDNLAAKKDNKNLVIEWKCKGAENNYWEVQGSANGKNFTTIGMVMGEDPLIAGNYKYKQELTKIKPGFKYYRVLSIESLEMAVASNTIGLSK